MYNEWNFLYLYKINSYKLISLDKKKMGIYKNYLLVIFYYIKSKIVCYWNFLFILRYWWFFIE